MLTNTTTRPPVIAHKGALHVEVESIRTVHWLDLIMRMDVPPQRKSVAFALARFANADGSRVFPGQNKVADMAGLHETNARKHIRALLTVGMLKVVQRGGGRGGATTTYRLTRPADLTTLPLWLDPNFDRAVAGGYDALSTSQQYRAVPLGESPVPDTEYRAPALGETDGQPYEHQAVAPGVSVDNFAGTPVDNPGTPSAGALHFNPVDNETPSVLTRNTERSVQKYRALALPDLPITSPLPPQHPAGLRKATNSLAETITRAAQPESIDAEYDTARAVMAAVDPELITELLAQAATQLVAAGDPDPPTRSVVVLAADLATRPDFTTGPS